MGGKSNMACLRGFEPPTFKSGVQLSAYMEGIGGASKRDRTSGLQDAPDEAKALAEA